MALNRSKTPRLKPLLDDLPPGFIVDTAWLKSRGIDSKSIHNYVNQGWIERIVRGVYRRPLPPNAQSTRLTWQPVLLSLEQLMDYNVHLGGNSALNLSFRIHHIMIEEAQHVHLYGGAPPWLKRLPGSDKFTLHKSTLFGNDPVGIVHGHPKLEVSNWANNIWRWPLRASCPERAILELIDELPGATSFEHVNQIFKMLESLHPELLMKLLNACRSIKVRRLFFVYAEIYQHPWLCGLHTDRIDFGRGPRALVPGGRFHPAYQISVPEFLLDTF